MQEPGIAEQLSQNITRQGLTNTTLNFLRVSAVVFFVLLAYWFPVIVVIVNIGTFLFCRLTLC